MGTLHENRSFCSSCGAPLTGGTFCGKCGAKIIATTAPVPAVEPVPAAEPAPVAVAAPEAAPVSLATTITWKFPLIPVILMGIVFILNLFTLFADVFAGQFSSVFVLYFIEVGCFALLTIGMIVCKKERNLLVAFGCLGLGVLSLAWAAYIINLYLSAGFDILTTLATSLTDWLDSLCFALIGLAYLVAKPKINGLKIAACIIPMSIGLLGQVAIIIVNKGSGAAATFANFMCYTVMLYVAVLLYTPFKKK